jgi:hypothetical protein
MTKAFIGRRMILGMALTITVWLAVQADDGEEDSVIPPAHSHQGGANRAPIRTGDSVPRSPVSTTASSSLNWSGLALRTAQARQGTGESPDLFKSHDWYVASRPVEPSPPPPRPVAPAVPFAYLGKLENAVQGTRFFLSGNGKVYVAGAGENIDGTWRLDTETETSLSLIYLPLGERQLLSKIPLAVSAENGNQGAY